jgi:Interferon-induced transmembrane protein
MSQEWTPPPASGPSGNVPNYMVPAIISAICCFPLGIISIIFAAQVNGKVTAGDTAGALEASKKAKMFSYIFIGLGVLGWVITIISWVVVGGLAALGNM